MTLIFDTSVLYPTAVAGRLEELSTVTRFQRKVVAPYVVYQELERNVSTRPDLAKALDLPWLEWITEVEGDDGDALAYWEETLVPRFGPRAGKNRGEAHVFAYAQSRGWIAVLNDKAMRYAQSSGGRVQAYWLTGLIDRLVPGIWTSRQASDFMNALLATGCCRVRMDILKRYSWYAPPD